MEHRAAAAPRPLTLVLADQPLHLEIRDADSHASTSPTSLAQRLIAALTEGPGHLDTLRAAVGARKQSVADTLRSLEAQGRVVRQADGWDLRRAEPAVPSSRSL